MIKRNAALMLVVLLMSVMLVSCNTDKQSEKDTEKAPVQSENVEETKIKNVIFLIPDGAGYASYDLANDVKVAGGFDTQKYPNKTPTDKSPMTMRSHLAGSMVTLNVFDALTDSAAAGTAMATGKKTVNGYIGIDENMKPIATILEAAQYVGKATGLVATYEWMHATPASFSSHAENRSDYKKLYEQIEDQGIEVVLGSGYGAVSQYATIQNAVDRGYTVVSDKAQLENVKPGDRLWGDFSNPSSPYDINLAENQPTLAEMTQAAITALSGDEDGFFLMVEGSKVDTGGHANDAVVTSSEYIAFDAAFRTAVEFAKGRNDTVVLAAPDHDTGAMKYDEIQNLELAVYSVRQGKDPIAIDWETTGHSEQLVGVWMYVPEGVDVIEGLSSTLGDTKEVRSDYVIDNTNLAPYIAELFEVDLDEITEQLFFDVTDIGRYSAAVGKFSFNNGDKYLYMNDSHYFKDGKEISMDGKVAIEINSRVYVPKEIVEEEDLLAVNEEGAGEVSGTGTADDPYIIDEAWDFVEFAGNLVLGETYKDVYFLQTKDIDLSQSSDFKGMDLSSEFAGTYNGGGYTINIALDVENDETLFPKVSGIVMNLGVTGYIKSEGAVNWAYTGGIVRSITEEGKLVNCTSNVDINSLYAGGLTGANKGTVANCFFGGSIAAQNKAFALSANVYGGTYADNYYADTCGAQQEGEGVAAVSAAELSQACEALNGKRGEYAAAFGLNEDALGYFRVSEDGNTVELYVPTPIVETVVVTPSEITVNKGDGVMLTAVVNGKYNPSQQVVWSIETTETLTGSKIYEDGFVEVSADETASGFTVLAKSAVDGSIVGACKVTVSDDVVTEANGSRARPYLVTNESEFLEFSNAVIAGKNMKDLYFKQTADFDMSTVEGYNGIPSAASFEGTYNGNGHIINLNIDSDADNSLFGSCRGMIMNVGTTGTVKGVSNPAGICRAVRDSGVVVNCFSLCDVIGEAEASGIVRSNYNVVANCYFAGTLSGPAEYNICYLQPSGKARNNFVIDDEAYTNGIETAVTVEEITSGELAQLLNNGREGAAKLGGIAQSLLCEWSFDESLSPLLG